MSIALGGISLLFLPILASPPPNLSIRRSDHVLEARRSDRGRVVDGLEYRKGGLHSSSSHCLSPLRREHASGTRHFIGFCRVVRDRYSLSTVVSCVRIHNAVTNIRGSLNGFGLSEISANQYSSKLFNMTTGSTSASGT